MTTQPPTDALRLVPVNARDLDALRYVLNRADDSNRIRTVMTTFTLPERETTAERLERLYAALKAPPASPLPGGGEPHIFLDCDGVLADFDTYAEAYFGMNPREYEKRMGSEQFWRELEAKGDFYRNLPLMPDARALYEGVKHLNPTILTGCPRGNWAEAQKVAWAHEHFPGVPVITCRSSDKRAHAKPGDVLIDDWPQHRHRWIEHGGVFISHFDADTSLAALWAHYPQLPAAPTGDAK